MYKTLRPNGLFCFSVETFNPFVFETHHCPLIIPASSFLVWTCGKRSKLTLPTLSFVSFLVLFNFFVCDRVSEVLWVSTATDRYVCVSVHIQRAHSQRPMQEAKLCIEVTHGTTRTAAPLCCSSSSQTTEVLCIHSK